MFQLLSSPLQDGVRFFLVPSPAPPWAVFANGCPRGERYGISTFRLLKYVGLGACYRPGGMWVTNARAEKCCSHLRYLLVRAYKPFPLVQLNDLYAGSHVFTIPTI